MTIRKDNLIDATFATGALRRLNHMNRIMNRRQQLLQALLTFDEPLNLIAQELSQLEWDHEGEPVLVAPLHIVSILNRFLSNQLNAKQVEEWANMIECREDLDYESENQKQLEQVIYELANYKDEQD